MVRVSIESLFAGKEEDMKEKYITSNQIRISCRKQKAKYSVAEKYFPSKNVQIQRIEVQISPSKNFKVKHILSQEKN